MPQILLCCVLALLLAALGLLLRSLHRRSRPSGGNETLKVLLVCFFICGILLHLPMYAAAYAGEHLSWLRRCWEPYTTPCGCSCWTASWILSMSSP